MNENKPKESPKIDNPSPQDFMSLVRKMYREEGIRPLSKALTEASMRWGEVQKERKISPKI